MTNYGPSFGFRRSAAEFWSGAEGRQRIPATGTFRQGDLVTLDATAPGYLALAANNAPIEPSVTGLLIQESAHIGSIYDGPFPSADTYERAKNGETAVIATGAGLKVWLKNRTESQRPGGKAVSARTIVDLTSVSIKSLLKWDGAKYAVTTNAAQAVMQVTLVDATAGYAEAVLVK